MNKLVNKANGNWANILLAHGAGAGKDSDFMQQLAIKLCDEGLNVIRFDFPYMQTIARTGKRRPPDRMDKLQEYFAEVLAKCDEALPIFIGGKSMGGRVASMMLQESRAVACVCYGYPFHPPGKPEKLRVEHLKVVQKPLLVVQGERDTFGNQQEIAEYGLPENIRLAYLKDGDHSFKPRKASGLTQDDHIFEAARLTAKFAKEVECANT